MQINPVIDLQHASFSYAGTTTPALRDITLTVLQGQICAVIGRAGAGKSTLCALVAGFIPHFFQGAISGSATVDSQNVFVRPISELVRHVALVGGNASGQLSGACDTVFEEVGFALQNLGVPRAEMIERIEWSLNALQITHLRDRSPYALSGGQQQRLVIAAALALRPPVLALDEPTAQLDPLAIEELSDLLRELAKNGTTMLIAEHRLEWVAALADSVSVIDAGQIVAEGPPREILTDPRLETLRIGRPRSVTMAQRAKDAGRWPADLALPITLEQLVDGIRGHSGSSTEAIHSPAARPLQTSNASNPILQIENIAYTYPSGVQALRGASLVVGRGERVALLGRNGAGKSTLVRHLNGLLRPSSGRVLVAGQDTSTTSVGRCARTVGIVFQDIRNQLFASTVRDELRFGPRNLGKSKSEIDTLVDRALAALDLTDAADSHPYDLAPARRRLVAIAAVLAMDTDVLVLDEPTAGLDNASIALLAQLVYDLSSRGKSAIVVSHDLDFCFETLDRIVLVRDGELTLDSPANMLDEAELAILHETIGLPFGLRAAQALALDASDPLNSVLLASAPEIAT
ncbi:MAG: ABC transporter ATP-binding protein [Roseiflexaceae bacterium]|nr:ABC transporter ATP-binding protein [Roseiflexaceae bacterium]